MPVTITAGITFSGGGLTMAFAPPSVATAGWFMGGRLPNSSTYNSIVDRITYATDTAGATTRGPLNAPAYRISATGTFTDGWIAGNSSAVQRITYATDTATASYRGPIPVSTAQMAAVTDSVSYGWFVGGQAPGAVTTVNRITYATDTATASIRGPLASAVGYMTGSNTTSYGWIGGGLIPGGYKSTVQRITYATDTDTATVRGPLSLARYGLAATGNSTDGWFAAGITNPAGPSSPVMFSTVDRITYATDTATAAVRGPLNAARYCLAATTDNSTYGWYAEGHGTPGQAVTASAVNRITYATDTVAGSVRYYSTTHSYMYAGSSGIQ
jgi:hypothetical protein